MKKTLILIALVLFSVQLFAQGFNGRPRPSGISSQEISLTLDSVSTNRLITAASTYSLAKFAAANAANLVKSLTDAKIATTNSNLNAEQYARINQIAAQQALITTLQNNATALESLLTATQSQVTAQSAQITNQGNLIGTQQATLANQNTLLAKYRARMDSLSINPNDLIANSVMNQWVDTKIAGTYFAPTAISFPTITATSIQSSLAAVTGATSYQLWKSTTSATAGFNFLTTLTPSNLLYNDTGLSASTNYWYRATATDGTHTGMPVTASATTLATTVDNSVASAGSTVIQYLDFSDLANKSVPANPNFHTNSNGNAIDGAIGLYSTDGNALSIANGLLTVAPVPNIKIYYNQFLVNKTYKITLYNIGPNVPRTVYINGGAGVNPVQSGSNVTYTFQAGGSNSTDAVIFPPIDSNNSALPFTMSAFKLEVQN